LQMGDGRGRRMNAKMVKIKIGLFSYFSFTAINTIYDVMSTFPGLYTTSFFGRHFVYQELTHSSNTPFR
jgi:hypothetical protein